MKTFSEFISEAKKSKKPSFHQTYEKKRRDIIKRSREEIESERAKIQKQKEENDKIEKLKKDAREEGKKEIIDKVKKEHGIEVEDR